MSSKRQIEVELDEELGQERCHRAAESGSTPNYRNGHKKKTVKTQLGQVEIQALETGTATSSRRS